MDPNLFLLLVTIVNLVSAVLTLVVWVTAYRASRFLGSVKMLFLSVSFLLFSLGLFSQTFYSAAALVEGVVLSRLFVGEGYLLYSTLMLAGYMILAFAYTIGEVGAAALSAITLTPRPVNNVARLFFNFRVLFEYGIQLLSAALLIYVLVKVYEEYFSKKASYSAPIAVGLTLLFIQLLVRVFDLDSAFNFLFASIIQLVGFSLIFYAVWKVNSK
ncbi:MAG: hypothetical protein QW514_05430 [Thermoprotei archaeon]